MKKNRQPKAMPIRNPIVRALVANPKRNTGKHKNLTNVRNKKVTQTTRED
jgi:hypothetical protein